MSDAFYTRRNLARQYAANNPIDPKSLSQERCTRRLMHLPLLDANDSDSIDVTPIKSESTQEQEVEDSLLRSPKREDDFASGSPRVKPREANGTVKTAKASIILSPREILAKFSKDGSRGSIVEPEEKKSLSLSFSELNVSENDVEPENMASSLEDQKPSNEGADGSQSSRKLTSPRRKTSFLPSTAPNADETLKKKSSNTGLPSLVSPSLRKSLRRLPSQLRSKKKTDLLQVFTFLEEENAVDIDFLKLPLESSEENIILTSRICEGKDISETVRLLMYKYIAAHAWPVEHVVGIRKKLLDEGIIPKLLQLAVEGHVQLFEVISRDDIELGDLIAKGASGIVYKAKWKNMDVAIKICGKMGMFYGTVEEFRFELAALCLFDHKNVLPCFGGNEKVKEPFIVLPLKEKGTLEDIVYSSSLPLSMKLHLAIQSAEGLQYLHKCGLIHRDLKPSNILIGNDFQPSLIDFGMSRIFLGNRRYTMNVGTTAWIAPEILEGDGNYTQAVDVYSFGLILYELVTHIRPYHQYQGFEIPIKVSEGVRPDIPSDTNDQLALLMQQCWHAIPKKRPSIDQVIERLKDIQQHSLFAVPSNSYSFRGNYGVLAEVPHPCCIDFLTVSGRSVWVGSIEGTIAVYDLKYDPIDSLSVPDMIVSAQWHMQTPILDIICVPGFNTWVFTKNGLISMWDPIGKPTNEIRTNYAMTAVSLISYEFDSTTNNTVSGSLNNRLVELPDESSPVLYKKIWCGQQKTDGRRFLTVWDMEGKEPNCVMIETTEEGPITCIAQYQRYVLVSIAQHIFVYDFHLTLLSSWRTIKKPIGQMQVVDTMRQNLWLISTDKRGVSLWDCRPSKKHGLKLHYSELSMSVDGKIGCIAQVLRDSNNSLTVWYTIDYGNKNRVLVRNGRNMQILQEIELPGGADKVGRKICVAGPLVLVAIGSDVFQNGCILCVGVKRE